MNAIVLDDAVSAMVDELGRRFGIEPTADVVGCVRRSIDDLSGSTSAESLPEMAFRLALVRLGAVADLLVAAG